MIVGCGFLFEVESKFGQKKVKTGGKSLFSLVTDNKHIIQVMW
jgi:hypothetical protein